MAEKFIMVWTIDDETMSMPHSTQDGALQRSACFRRYSVLSVIGGWCTGRQSAVCIRLLTLRSSHCENQIRLLRVKPGPSLPGEKERATKREKGASSAVQVCSDIATPPRRPLRIHQE
jgi:hypothetical protein